MNTHIHIQFNKQIINIKNFGNILVAISGGQDSLCLVKLIEDFKQQDNIKAKIEYIYIDHKWRKDCKEQIKHLINYIYRTSSLISIYEISNIPYSELEARQLRYNTIVQHAIKNNYSSILTAHTKSDRIETFIQQLIRGTSLDGATSLTFQRKLKNNLHLIRPLINIHRKDINWFCRKFCLPIWSDTTNYQYNITRNRLRYELIPYLNQYFTLQSENNINKFIIISNRDNEYIKQNAIKLYLISRHKINIALNYSLIKEQHHAIQMRTLEIFVYHHFNKSLNYNTLLKIVTWMNKDKVEPQKVYWNQLTINNYNNWIYIN